MERRSQSPVTSWLKRRIARAWALSGPRWRMSAPHPALAEALGEWAERGWNTHDHLSALFAETVAAGPGLVVELGVRSGVSTRALLAAAEVVGGQVLSVDLGPRPELRLPQKLLARWSFVQSDDVPFAGAPFEAWCAERGLAAEARSIFIDTAHTFEHTRRELAAWLPRLGAGGVMLLHDTNMRSLGRTLDGGVLESWDNRRGVMRALEALVGRAYDEGSYFADVADGLVITHVPWSSGLTVLRRRR